MNWGKTIWKFVQSTLIAAGVMVTTALLAGLQDFTPEAGTQQLIWKLGGATLIGLVTALLNWLKHRKDVVPNP